MDTDDLDGLRRRSEALAGEAGPDALEVNRAILALAPGDPVASNRLGIALLTLHRYDEAEEVLAAAVAAHPDNAIGVRCLEEARRRRRAPAPPASARGGATGGRSATRGPTHWIKALHYHDDGWTIEPGTEAWISDIGCVPSRWTGPPRWSSSASRTTASSAGPGSRSRPTSTTGSSTRCADPGGPPCR